MAEIKLSDLEKLRLEYEKEFATEGCIENHTVYNTDYLTADRTLVDVWEFFIKNLPRLVNAKCPDNASASGGNAGYSERATNSKDKASGAVAEDITLFDSAKILLNGLRVSCKIFSDENIPIPEHLWNAQKYSALLVDTLEKYLDRDYSTKD